MKRKKYTYDERKVNIVGDFFEDLSQLMVGGEKGGSGEEFDLYLWDIETGIEVKGSDMPHDWRLPTIQMGNHKKRCTGFPLEYAYYFLFSYRNKRPNGGNIAAGLTLSVCKDKESIREFLARNLETAFILDIRFVEKLPEICPISDRSIPLNKGVESLDVRRSILEQSISDGSWQNIASEIEEVQLTTCEVKFDAKLSLLENYSLAFNLIIVASKTKTEELLAKMGDYNVAISGKCITQPGSELLAMAEV